jgi:hypothetical protein
VPDEFDATPWIHRFLVLLYEFQSDVFGQDLTGQLTTRFAEDRKRCGEITRVNPTFIAVS